MIKKKKIGVPGIVAVGIHVVRYVVRQIVSDVQDDPETALESLHIGKQGKPALRVDVSAEDSFKRELHRYRGGKFKKVKLYGEESLRNKDLDLSTKKDMVVLIDAVDGTDLAERGFSNWCSAAAFFDPRNEPGKRLIAAFVGVPVNESPADVYYATSEDSKAFVRRNKEMIPLAGPSKVKSIRQASICFYGQKTDNYLSVAQGSFTNRLSELNTRAKNAGKKLNLRIYNMAGIPMIVRLSDHRVSQARGVDAVFEVEGQKPHDCVPGLFIAKKAGAIVRDLDGKDFSIEQMENLLLNPASKEQSYIVTSTKELNDELRDLVKP